MCLGALVGGCVLSGCTIDPFVDGRREAGTAFRVGPSTPDRVAICYNRRGATPQDVIQLAREECAKTDRQPQYLYQEHIQCSALNPTRAYFACVGESG